MSQVRLASRLAASAAHLRFPPKDALYVPRDAPAPPFSPEAWALVHPPPPSALAAFAHRLGIPDSPAVLHACTHPSFLALFRQLRPGDALPATNAQLAALGNALMGLFASEHLHAAYPHLPTRVLKAAVTARVGPLSCANVAQEIGAAPLVRWHRTPPSPSRPAVLHTDALSSVSRSLTALVYKERSISAARQFVHSHFLSREIDLRGMIKFANPKKALLEMVKKFGREAPKSRCVPCLLSFLAHPCL
ncbi:hypothetical protein AX14_012339 [Amanita brunnescens Koide BX004]|nr:hypothetical protein AX14_012339 [Amanita brunnescens Koide BX004]